MHVQRRTVESQEEGCANHGNEIERQSQDISDDVVLHEFQLLQVICMPCPVHETYRAEFRQGLSEHSTQLHTPPSGRSDLSAPLNQRGMTFLDQDLAR